MSTELEKMMHQLSVSDKQLEFCEEYLRTLNMTGAYRSVYGEQGKTNYQLYAAAKKKLNEKGVREYIDFRRKEAREELVIDTTRVMGELAAIAFTDITDVVDLDRNGASLKDPSEIAPEHKKAIKKITVREVEHEHGMNRSIVIEMHDKQKAIETLAKHLGILTDAKNLTQNNVTNNVVMLDPSKMTTEQLKQLQDAQNAQETSD